MSIITVGTLVASIVLNPLRWLVDLQRQPARIGKTVEIIWICVFVTRGNPDKAKIFKLEKIWRQNLRRTHSKRMLSAPRNPFWLIFGRKADLPANDWVQSLTNLQQRTMENRLLVR